MQLGEIAELVPAEIFQGIGRGQSKRTSSSKPCCSLQFGFAVIHSLCDGPRICKPEQTDEQWHFEETACW